MMPKRPSRKKIKRLERQSRLRDRFELWVCRHNHKMELVRTLTSVMGLVVSSIVMMKVFGII